MDNFYTYHISTVNDSSHLAVESSTGKLYRTAIGEIDQKRFSLIPAGNGHYYIFSIFEQKFLTSNDSNGLITATSVTPHPFVITHYGKSHPNAYVIMDTDFSLAWQFDLNDANAPVFGGDETQDQPFFIEAVPYPVDE